MVKGKMRTLGSSPHARGAVRAPVTAGLIVGVIPARAGSGLSGCSRRSSRRGHPRTRGERTARPGVLWNRGAVFNHFH